MPWQGDPSEYSEKKAMANRIQVKQVLKDRQIRGAVMDVVNAYSYRVL